MILYIESIARFVSRFRQAQIPLRAAALAYHTLLALVPLVGLAFWYLQKIGITEKWLLLLKRFVLKQLNVSSSQDFIEVFQTMTGAIQSNSWGWIGLLLLVYSSWSLVVRFGDSLDDIMGDPSIHSLPLPTRSMVFLKRMGAMLGLPIALTLSLVVSYWIRRDSIFHYLFELDTVGPFFAILIPLFVDVVVFVGIYRLVPRRVITTREALRVALIVAPLVEITRFLFSIYNSYAVSVYKIYGVLAVIPMFILWVQIGWMVILAGGLLVKNAGHGTSD